VDYFFSLTLRLINYLLVLIFYRQQVLGDLTLIQLRGKTKNVKESQGFLLR
jgi:hypothetical protein